MFIVPTCDLKKGMLFKHPVVSPNSRWFSCEAHESVYMKDVHGRKIIYIDCCCTGLGGLSPHGVIDPDAINM